MTLVLRPPEQSELQRIEELYTSTFPRIERYNFNKLLAYTGYDAGFYVIDDGGYRGFIYTIDADIAFFLLYLAVDPAFRCCGYGSQVLEKLKAEHPGETIFVDVEPPEGEDIEIRSRRVRFYERHGFVSNGILVLPPDERYVLMSCGGKMDLDETRAFFKELDILI